MNVDIQHVLLLIDSYVTCDTVVFVCIDLRDTTVPGGAGVECAGGAGDASAACTDSASQACRVKESLGIMNINEKDSSSIR